MLHNVFYSIDIYNSQFGYQGHGISYYSITDFGKRLLYVVFTMEKHEPLLGGFWFLKTLFLASVLIILLSIIPSKHKQAIMSCFLFVGLFVSKYFILHIPVIGDCSIVFMGSVFYFLGFQYRKIESLISYRGIFIIVAFLILFFLTKQGIIMSMYSSFDDTFLYIPIALLGIYGCLGLSYQLDRYRLKVFFYYVGKHTMQILALHFLSFKTVGACVIVLYCLPMGMLSEIPVVSYKTEIYWMIYSVVGVVLPLILYQMYDLAKRISCNKLRT